jgi:hypothetical protein
MRSRLYRRVNQCKERARRLALERRAQDKLRNEQNKRRAAVLRET